MTHAEPDRPIAERRPGLVNQALQKSLETNASTGRPEGRWWSPSLAFRLSAILADSIAISLILIGFFRISLPLGVIDRASRSRAKPCGIRTLPSSAEVWPARPPQPCWAVPAYQRC